MKNIQIKTTTIDIRKKIKHKRITCLSKIKVCVLPFEEDSYLWQKPINVVRQQRNLIEEFSEQFLRKIEQNRIDDFFENLNQMNQSITFYIGRVIEGYEKKTKIDLKDVFLENFLENRSIIVKLDLSQLSEFSLFPGQVVVLKGSNPTGNEIIVFEIWSDFSFFNSISKNLRILNNTKSQIKHSLIIQIGCGPFYYSDLFGFEQALFFHEFFYKSKKIKPDVIILCGPFLDETNELIENCSFVYQDEWIKFLRKLKDCILRLKLENTSFFFIPSIRDLHHRPSFPQPPFNTIGTPNNWYFISNPSFFTIESLVFAVSSFDSLFFIRERGFFQGNSNNLVLDLPSHLVQQKSFLPIYPILNESIDWSAQHNFKFPLMPDILIIPSCLTCFARQIQGKTIYINPGKLSLRKCRGTFAWLQISAAFKKGLQVDIEYI